MSCSSPNLAIDFGINPATGKHRINFVRPRVGESVRDYQSRYGSDNVLLIPCGNCFNCLLEKRKTWAIRCALEAQSHDDNCFVTLTYDEQHCPKKLIKRDLQDFIKNIRNLGYKCRYFACGEYGTLGRPHYHAVIFGYKPKDMTFNCKSKSGEAMFDSIEIDSCWKKGITIVQEFSSAAAGYVAGYVGKKLGCNDGFILMSKRPGLGYQYFIDNMHDIYKFDNICENLGSYKVVKPDRYFDKLAVQFGVDIDGIKKDRINFGRSLTASKLRSHKFEHVEDLFIYDRLEGINKFNKLTRGI